MFRALKSAVVFTGALGLGAFLGTLSSASPAHANGQLTLPSPNMQRAGAAVQPPHDPNRKNAGEPCKSSDECQRHHSCAKVGDRNVCQAPPPQRLPPGAVT
jgi:hypothetical protein